MGETAEFIGVSVKHSGDFSAKRLCIGSCTGMGRRPDFGLPRGNSLLTDELRNGHGGDRFVVGMGSNFFLRMSL
jgi:hypothetical protein